MKSFIKKIIPEQILIWYHYAIAHAAAFFYCYPTRKMVVIGITGTKGKTTTANYVWSVLSTAGNKVGLIGTANIRIGADEKMNPYHMTMPKPFVLQKILSDMRRAGCTHVVMEATSEGMKLGRHIGIHFDIGIFTNLTPEHLPNHGGSFDKYKEAKAILFRSLRQKHKIINGVPVPVSAIINTDDPHGHHYLSVSTKAITYGINSGDTRAHDIKPSSLGTKFSVEGVEYHTPIVGAFNVYNAMPAIAVAKLLGIDTETIARGIKELNVIPGRMEIIGAGQPFTVIVDYAHEKASMNALLDAASLMKKEPSSKTIVLFGAQGGGRDKEKRKWMGIAAGEKADIVILTSDDSYEEKPESIMEDIAIHARESGKQDGKNLFLLSDRRSAIRKAFELAENNDIVLLAGKGSEQFMITNQGNVPWDDRVVAREELAKII